ncbi:Retrovirus-related Pol polyprotein from transposon 17.6 [Cucumis melo var. makuwa]|uniref:Retrovirus-related Pol polyprotein from transposon 17.6 n=1 Tax=Cucumis melo var. makuwa TaxID=1194695 RepID=A0A5A7T474_CUCMM|nr:Retrovirus-related Pol polyprotein from transposon 17.6 [Cucumis melo var. makuwa]
MTFITLWGTFCYKVMPFGLKNAGATYQRAMVTLFHDMMHKEIEVYVDDMIAKSKADEDHTTTLQKLFDRLRKYQLKLNPSKCTFGATSGKLLGFIVSEEEIKVDPNKVRAIMEMPSPKTEKEIRGFLGRLNYISRFISHLTPTCKPIFKLLRKNNPEKWNEDCEEAFNKIKQYLQSPPVLIPPAPGRPLILYLTVLESSMGGVLGQHDLSWKKEHAIYYLSKKFTDYESRYSILERTCCALGMDVIGPIDPKASNGHHFILVAIDYFTKWIEAASYCNVTRGVVLKFIKKELICRYGLPEGIITDNAKNLNNKMMDKLYKQFKINHQNSTLYRPKMNGAVEAANKNIKRIIEKMTITYKDWHEMLPFALHEYRTSVRTSIGATPFSLVYGMEAVLPLEVEIPSLRVLMEAKLDEAEWIRDRYEQLNFVEEKWLAALNHGQLYQRRLMRAYNKKVHPRSF